MMSFTHQLTDHLTDIESHGKPRNKAAILCESQLSHFPLKGGKTLSYYSVSGITLSLKYQSVSHCGLNLEWQM